MSSKIKNKCAFSVCLNIYFYSLTQYIPYGAYAQTPQVSAIPTDITVKGRHKQKTKDAIDHYNTKNIDNLAAMTIGEVITRLERRNGGRPFSVIVNGRRLADISDLEDIPPEALASVDILPNSSAGRYGYSAENKVLNLVLKKNFASLTTDAGLRVPTERGGDGANTAFRYVKIRNEKRFNAALSGQATEALQARDRENLLDNSNEDAALLPYRTLLPSNRTIALRPGMAIPIGSLSLNASASLSDTLSHQLSRFFSTGTQSGNNSQSASTRGVVDLSRSHSYQFGLNMSGTHKHINWTTELTGSLSTSQTSSRISGKHIPIVLSGGNLTSLPINYVPLATSTTNESLGAALTGNAPLATFPAGDLNANTRLNVDLQRLASTNQSEQFVRQTNTQMRSRAHFGLDVPLTSPDFSPLDILGSSSLSLNADYERAEHVGGMPSYDLSWQWQPLDSLSITISRSATGALTTLSSSHGPIIYTPGALIVDAVTGNYALVTRISGGTPNLRSSSENDMTARINFSQTIGSTNIAATVEYVSAKIDNPLISAVMSNPQFQTLFPDRFIRDAAGNLTMMDTRPFNAAGQTTNTLRPNIHLSGSVDTDSENPDQSLDWDFSLSHEWALSDRLQPGQGAASVDLLKTPLDGVRGTPRHQVNVETEVSYRRFNLQFSAKWRSGSHVQDLTATEPYSVHYSAFWTADAVISYTFKVPGKSPNTEKSLRVWLSVNNILNKREIVRDSTGHTPAAYQPAFLDPAGRIVMIRASVPF